MTPQVTATFTMVGTTGCGGSDAVDDERGMGARGRTGRQV